MTSAVLTALIFCLSSLPAFAKMTVRQVKGDRVLVHTDEALPSVGSLLEVRDPKGKWTGKIKVSSARGQLFVGSLTQGTAESGSTLETAEEEPAPRPAASWLTAWGANLTLWRSQLHLQTPGAELTLAGSLQPGLGVFADKNITKNWRVRAGADYVPLRISQTIDSASCDGGRRCDVKIDYLSGRAAAQYFSRGPDWTLAAGLGLGLFLPLTKSTNFLNPGTVGLTRAFEVQLGAEYKYSNRWDAGVQLQVLQLPSGGGLQVEQQALSFLLRRKL